MGPDDQVYSVIYKFSLYIWCFSHQSLASCFFLFTIWIYFGYQILLDWLLVVVRIIAGKYDSDCLLLLYGFILATRYYLIGFWF